MSSKACSMGWQSLKCFCSEVRLEITLKCGQSFRWNYDKDTGEWIGVLKGKLWRLKQTEDEILFQTLPPSQPKDNNKDKEALTDYFQLHVSAAALTENSIVNC